MVMNDINNIKAVVRRRRNGGNNNRRMLAFLLACCFMIVSINCAVGLRDDENTKTSNQKETEAEECKMPIIDAVKRLFSLPTTYSDHWILKALFQGWPYFPPPNLDFRGGGWGDEVTTAEEGATEKVKDAMVKSFDKSKETVEDSAKSAAKLAEEAVDKTVKKLKRTLSGKGEDKDAAEL